MSRLFNAIYLSGIVLVASSALLPAGAKADQTIGGRLTPPAGANDLHITIKFPNFCSDGCVITSASLVGSDPTGISVIVPGLIGGTRPLQYIDWTFPPPASLDFYVIRIANADKGRGKCCGLDAVTDIKNSYWTKNGIDVGPVAALSAGISSSGFATLVNQNDFPIGFDSLYFRPASNDSVASLLFDPITPSNGGVAGLVTSGIINPGESLVVSDFADPTLNDNFLAYTLNTFPASAPSEKGLQAFTSEFIPCTVPGPLPLLGVGATFGFSRKLRKRIRRSATPVSSSYTI